MTTFLTDICQLDGVVGRHFEQDDLDVTVDRHSSHGPVAEVVQRLGQSGLFDSVQLSLIETELRRAIGAQLAIQAGTPLEKGLRIGRFRVDEPLGRGGEGHVYRGLGDRGEFSAIKILHNMRVSDRFRREMHLVRQLAHPNIVTAYEVGEFGGLPFITMELLRGPDLNVLVRESGPLGWREASRYILQAAHALAHAHQRDLIHRDVKPGNLILHGEGNIKLVDLGLASTAGNESTNDSVFRTETADGHLAGTLPYMAPEQARSLANATVQSDIYGLGATWFYLLTGKDRVRGKTLSTQYRNLLVNRRFNLLPNKLLPPALQPIFKKMIAYDVVDRYTDCLQLASDLEAALITTGESGFGIDGINVLVIEDSRTDMVLAIEMLRRSNSTLSIYEARTLTDGLDVCTQMPINLVLLDLSLPDSASIETVTRFRSVVPDVPLVVLTGMSDDEVRKQCLEAGASAFLSKSGLTPHRMERTIFVTLSRCVVPNAPCGARQVLRAK